jgi:hypothetical protein
LLAATSATVVHALPLHDVVLLLPLPLLLLLLLLLVLTRAGTGPK